MYSYKLVYGLIDMYMYTHTHTHTHIYIYKNTLNNKDAV